MKLVIDTDKCWEQKCPSNIAILLLALQQGANTKDSIDYAINTGLISYRDNGVGTDYTKFALTRAGAEMIETILLNSEITEKKNNVDRYVNLAERLREIYPTGKKEGTAYQWRDSTPVIALRLKSLVKRYGDTFTDEQAIEATRKYVQSFNGNYRYMQLLKYFIMKNNLADRAEDTSQLLSYIANEGQQDIQDYDNGSLL